MRGKAQKSFTSRMRLLLVFFFAVMLAFITMPLSLLNGRAYAEETERVAPERKTTAREADAEPLPTFNLRIVYYRPDITYTGWNVWLWSAGEGKVEYTNNNKGLPFEKTQYLPSSGKTVGILEYEVEGCVPKEGNALGLIVRLNEWEKKDVDEDRFITVADLQANLKSNRLTVYIVSGVKQLYYNQKEAMTDKITVASFTDYENVAIETNAKITAANNFVIKDDLDNVCGTLDCSSSANSKYVGTLKATIPFTGTFDFDRTYTVYDEGDTAFEQMPVQVNKLYDTAAFGDKYNYSGELGVNYTKTKSTFTVWAPTASEVKLNVYASGEVTDTAKQSHVMTKGSKGEWTVEVAGDLNGKYYTYSLGSGADEKEVVDPYARSGGRDGKRGMILDLDSTDPQGWNDANAHKIPDYGTTANAMSKAVIWEAQLRDVTIHESSGVSEANRGKFLGLTETGTKNSKGQATALDYLKELGVTQVHFQPLFDFASVNEKFDVATYNQNGEYNWGYDPLNYNMPEGSYSSDPADGRTRVNEMKQMIMALHNAGIQVIMDVVYNHVANAASSNFEQLVPGYYFRMTPEGGYYNGSGCGNETASERYMFRRFMIDSVKYWTEEYKIDGFRFDLMGVHDIVTMNELYDTLAAINPDVIIYGEGWTGGTTGLDDDKSALLANAAKMPNISVFNDITRDGLKGSVFDIAETGFATGKGGSDYAVYVGAAGGTSAIADSIYSATGKKPFAKNPTQNISYVSAHDNSTLWDKMNASVDADKKTIMSMYRLSATSVLTSQGASFFLAGEEMMRSKPTTEDGGTLYDNRPQHYLRNPNYWFSDNSYKSADSVNAINWDNLNNKDTADMMEFYKQLIAIKKTFPQFQFTETETLKGNLFIKDGSMSDGVAGYAIKDPTSGQYAVVLFNATDKTRSVSVPNGKYSVYVNGAKANATQALSTFNGSKMTVGAYSSVVMTGTVEAAALSDWALSSETVADNEDSNLGLALGLGIGIPAAVLIAGGAVFGVMYGKKKKGKKDGESDKDEADADDKPEDNGPDDKSDEEQPSNDDAAQPDEPSEKTE